MEVRFEEQTVSVSFQ